MMFQANQRVSIDAGDHELHTEVLLVLKRNDLRALRLDFSELSRGIKVFYIVFQVEMASKRDKKVRRDRPEDGLKPFEVEQCRRLLDQGALGWKICQGPRLSQLPSSQERLLGEMSWMAVDVFEQRKLAMGRSLLIAESIKEYWKKKSLNAPLTAAALVQSFFCGSARSLGVSIDEKFPATFVSLEPPSSSIPRARGTLTEPPPITHRPTTQASISPLLAEYAQTVLKTALRAEGLPLPVSVKPPQLAAPGNLNSSPVPESLSLVLKVSPSVAAVETELHVILRKYNGELCRGFAAPTSTGLTGRINQSSSLSTASLTSTRMEAEAVRCLLTEVEFSALLGKHTELFSLAADALDFHSSSIRNKRDKSEDDRKRKGAGISPEDQALRRTFLSALLSAYRHGGGGWKPSEESILNELVCKNGNLNWTYISICLDSRLSFSRFRTDLSKSALQCERRWREKQKKEESENFMKSEENYPIISIPRNHCQTIQLTKDQARKLHVPGHFKLSGMKQIPLSKALFTPLERKGTLVRKTRSCTNSENLKIMGLVKLPQKIIKVSADFGYPFQVLQLATGSQGNYPGFEITDEKISSALGACIAEKRRSPVPLKAFPFEEGKESVRGETWKFLAKNGLNKLGLSENAGMEAIASELVSHCINFFPVSNKKQGRIVSSGVNTSRPSPAPSFAQMANSFLKSGVAGFSSLRVPPKDPEPLEDPTSSLKKKIKDNQGLGIPSTNQLANLASSLSSSTNGAANASRNKIPAIPAIPSIPSLLAPPTTGPGSISALLRQPKIEPPSTRRTAARKSKN